MWCRTPVYLAIALITVVACGQQAAHSGTPEPATQLTSTTTTTGPTTNGTSPVTEPAEAAVLTAIRVGSHPGYDRVVFEFHGRPGSCHTDYVEQVTRDGSGLPISLRGNAFLMVTLHGATMDNSFQVTDPTRVMRYAGPKRLTPLGPIVQEVAEAGDFEADLTFGIGLSHRVPARVTELSSPYRIVIDFPR